LRRGDYRQVFVDDRSRVYAFARTLGSEKILVVMNAGQSVLPVDRSLKIYWAGRNML
jgi:hypothetical protein